VDARWCSSDVLLSRWREVASSAFVGVLALSAAVAGAAVVGTAAVQPDLGTLLGGLGLAAAFGIARTLAIEVEVRRDTARLVPTEIPLVFGLLYLPGPVVLAAYVGVVVIGRLLRRDTWSKLLFNVSYATLTVTLTDLVARLVFEPTWPSLPQSTSEVVVSGTSVEAQQAVVDMLANRGFALVDRKPTTTGVWLKAAGNRDNAGYSTIGSVFYVWVVLLAFLDPVCTTDCPVIAAEMRAADTLLGSKASDAELVAEKLLAERMIERFGPFREVRSELSPEKVMQILDEGSKNARDVARKTMAEVRQAVGLPAYLS